MQDIVYKLVPDLQQSEYSPIFIDKKFARSNRTHTKRQLISDEMAREREFYRIRGIPCPKDAVLGDATNGGQGGDRTTPANDENHPDSTDYHRRDEQV